MVIATYLVTYVTALIVITYTYVFTYHITNVQFNYGTAEFQLDTREHQITSE